MFLGLVHPYIYIYVYNIDYIIIYNYDMDVYVCILYIYNELYVTIIHDRDLLTNEWVSRPVTIRGAEPIEITTWMNHGVMNDKLGDSGSIGMGKKRCQ